MDVGGCCRLLAFQAFLTCTSLQRNPRSPAPQRARKAKKVSMRPSSVSFASLPPSSALLRCREVALSKKPGSKRPEKGLLIRQPLLARTSDRGMF